VTTGEVQAHLAEVYGAEVSGQTISTITDAVLEGMAQWQNRPLDPVYPVYPVYPVIFIDAIVRHEAPHDRVEVKDLHRRVVAAA
jgi:transposase-like protein